MSSNLFNDPMAFTVLTVDSRGLEDFDSMIKNELKLLRFASLEHKEAWQVEEAHRFLEALGNTGAVGKDLLGRALTVAGFAETLVDYRNGAAEPTARPLMKLIELVHKDDQKVVLDNMEKILRGNGQNEAVDRLRGELAGYSGVPSQVKELET